MDKLGKEHSFTQTSKELTETRNKTKEKLINECMAEQIVDKYCHFSHLFFVVEYATNFLIVTREGKRRIYEKHTNIVKVMLRKKTSCVHQPVCFNINFSSHKCIVMCMVHCFMSVKRQDSKTMNFIIITRSTFYHLNLNLRFIIFI